LLDDTNNGATNHIDNPVAAHVDLFASGASSRRNGKFKHNIVELKQQVKALA